MKFIVMLLHKKSIVYQKYIGINNIPELFLNFVHGSSNIASEFYNSNISSLQIDNLYFYYRKYISTEQLNLNELTEIIFMVEENTFDINNIEKLWEEYTITENLDRLQLRLNEIILDL